MKWLSCFDKTAIISGERHISYIQFMDLILRTGEDLKQHCAKEDRIAILGANSPEWIVAMYAIWHIHAIVVPVDFMSTPEEIAYILDDCTPSAVWCDEVSKDKLTKALASVKNATPIVMELESLKETPSNGTGNYGIIGESDNDEMAFIIYTSGTTGSPKGVMLTFGNLESNTDACSKEIQVFIPDDRVLVLLPLHHAYPLMASVVMPLSIGATSVFAKDMTSTSIMSALKDSQCTFIVAVPRLSELFRNSMMQKINASLIARIMYRICCFCNSLWLSRHIFRKVQDAFGGHIRYISCGGAANDPLVTRDFYALGFELLEGYGMTETAPMISFTPPGHHKPGSPGKPIPCNEVKIENDEVLVRGANIMKGYYHKPEETAQALDKDGWLHTGDLGYLDNDGFLHLTGRSKELIILGNGKNITPTELEQHLMNICGGLFEECAVTDDGRNLIALIVPDMEAIEKQGILNIKQTIIDEVIEPFNESVPSYKRLADIIIRTTPLPRTRLGKLRRHIIRQELSGNGSKTTVDDAHASTPAPDNPTYAKVAACIEKLAGRAIGPDEHFELELGLDSLAKISLLSSLSETFKRDLSVEILVKHPTARTLSEEIAAGSSTDYEEQDSGFQKVPEPCCLHGLYRGITSALFHAISHLTVSGKENLPSSACIFAPNHLSSLDGFALGAVLDSKRFKNTYFYAISKYVDGWFSGWFARRHNIIAMELNGDIRKSLSLLEKALKDGKSVVIFPEGTRSMDGALGEFRPTFAQLAIKAQVPIVP
ncbi:MAG: AMP-binding protein, partial [Victivallales bacterium]|nr:AMP-binding protein [Victivallales bacterium]